MSMNASMRGLAAACGLALLVLGSAAWADTDCKDACQQQYEECIHKHSGWGPDPACADQETACLAMCSKARDN
jgi:hypothetical protein